MSRLPTPDPGWETSTEGDLDDDLAEETPSDLEDWQREQPRSWWGTTGVRIVSVLMLIAILGTVVAEVMLAR
jgi:hypothetical protein